MWINVSGVGDALKFVRKMPLRYLDPMEARPKGTGINAHSA